MAEVDIDDWVRMVEGRLEMVAKIAAQAVAENANETIYRGGRMRFDTGFLRNSIKAAIGRRPSGPSGPSESQGDASAIEEVIARWVIDKPLYIGWTANYAEAREAQDGFLEAEVMKWQQHVDDATAEAKRRISA